MSSAKRVMSFRTKLLWSLIGISALATVLICALLARIHFVSVDELVRSHLKTQAAIIATHSQAALSFNDNEAGRETLAALRAHPGVVWAGLYDTRGKLFASYSGDGISQPPPAITSVDPIRSDKKFIQVAQTIDYDQRRLGVIVLVYDRDVLFAPLRRDILLSLLTGLLVTLFAAIVALRLRRSLTRPLAELVATARRVSEEGDYAARAVRHAPDEFGDLTDTFNTMLDHIQAQNQELRDRHQEMQQLLYTVSHDLKSPLVTITGFVGFLHEDLARQRYDDVGRSMDHLLRATKRMGRLIEDLLELSRIGRVNHDPKPIDSGAVVKETIEDLAPRAAAVGAVIKVQPRMPTVVADPFRLRQVFENLLINAIKYGLPKQNGAAAAIEVGGWRENGEAKLFVRDHGQGVPKEHHERVFALFQRLHTSDEGTGVGLTVASRIVQTHGGRIWLEDTPGGGATFWITLPDSPPAVNKVLQEEGAVR